MFKKIQLNQKQLKTLMSVFSILYYTSYIFFGRLCIFILFGLSTGDWSFVQTNKNFLFVTAMSLFILPFGYIVREIKRKIIE